MFDPGANTVGLTLAGAGKSGLKVSQYFFEKLAKKNIPTHYLDANVEACTMHVKDAEMFGEGLEVICRYKAVGSFYRRYGKYCEEGQELPEFIEITLKDDERNDPPISKEGLTMLNILKPKEYDRIKELTKEISKLVKSDLNEKNLELYDIKLEFGKDSQGNIMLIDEISGGNMRVYKGDKYIEPLKLEPLLFE